jgi:anti-sigma factor RsiW
MDCDRCTIELSAYLDGELSSPEMRDLESHLYACKPCAEELRSLSASSLFVEMHTPALDLRDALWQNVRARVEALPAKQDRVSIFDSLFARRWPAMAFTAAFALLLMAGILGILRHQEGERALILYMSAYIHDRDRQEEIEQSGQAGTRLAPAAEAELQTDSPDNPFVTASFNADENPFRSEDQ